jgi:1-acyl-sn-glycerol-3-phosphate acyltransferase
MHSSPVPSVQLNCWSCWLKLLPGQFVAEQPLLWLVTKELMWYSAAPVVAIQIRGRENLPPPERPVVYVANHQSFLVWLP